MAPRALRTRAFTLLELLAALALMGLLGAALGASLHIGFRTPGLSKVLSPAEKIALAQELGMRVVEPQHRDVEFPSLEVAREMRRAGDDAGVRIMSMGCELALTGTPNAPELRAQMDTLLEHAQILGVSYVFSRVMPQPEGVSQQVLGVGARRRDALRLEMLGGAAQHLAEGERCGTAGRHRLRRSRRSRADDGAPRPGARRCTRRGRPRGSGRGGARSA